VGDYYYLMISEGGTSYDHSVTIARSTSPWGPFEPCPHNPILTHRDRRDLPIQATGHADLVELADGTFWLVFLGIRPWDGEHHHLGREAFLARVDWVDGWPVVNTGRPVALEASAAGLPGLAALPSPQTSRTRDTFEGQRLPVHYQHVRNPRPENYQLAARPGWLRLLGSAATLDDLASPTFVGRRQQHVRARVSTRLSFEPGAGRAAGLVVRGNEDNHYDLLVTGELGDRVVRATARVAGSTRVLGEAKIPDGDVSLRVEAHPDRYELFVSLAAGEVQLGQASTVALSSEVAGGFTGVYFGLVATGQGAVADFAELVYEGL
jgi:alpha-N-arabinofuranosidase